MDNGESQSPQAAVPYNSVLFPANHLRRNRKRSWPHRFATEYRTGNENAPVFDNADPLEKIRRNVNESYSENGTEVINAKTSSSAGLQSLVGEKPPGNLLYPNSVWYPPYPPFFIDLRVSGTICDENNETKPKGSSGLDPKSRQGSAFTVPPPSSRTGPINLSTSVEDGQFIKEKRQQYQESVAKHEKRSRFAEYNSQVEREGMNEIGNRSGGGGGFLRGRNERNENSDEVIAVDDNNTEG